MDSDGVWMMSGGEHGIVGQEMACLRKEVTVVEECW